MLIDLNRKYKKADYTIGIVSIDGVRFSNSLEDTDRGLNNTMTPNEVRCKKIYGSTAIPTGTYEVIFTYSIKYKKEMPILLNVPGFEGIRIHSGNTAADTEGCIIIGDNTAKGCVTNSKNKTSQLYDRIRFAISKGERIYIKIY